MRGHSRLLTVPEVGCSAGLNGRDLSDSQADSAGSIPVTRSTTKAGARARLQCSFADLVRVVLGLSCQWPSGAGSHALILTASRMSVQQERTITHNYDPRHHELAASSVARRTRQ